MNATLRMTSTNRTVEVVLRHALDLDGAVDLLYAEYGFDALVLALATIDDPRAAQALWTVLCIHTFSDAG